MSPHHDRIDTHIHFIPPCYASALVAADFDMSGYPLPQFKISSLFTALEELDVKTAVLSVSAPGPAIAGSGPQGRELARKCNDEGIEIISQGGGRLKLFGSTPCWTDVQGTIDEIDYCIRTLKCAGIVCMTTYGDRLLGDPLFKPIWDKLDALGAVVFIHPSEANIIPRHIASTLSPSFVDFPQQTTRTAVDLVFTGTLHAHPNVKPILSHSAGTLPYLFARISSLGLDVAPPKNLELTKDSVVNDFRRFWVDVAIGTSRAQLIGLLEYTSPDKILFGSDWPFFPLEQGIKYRRQLDDFLETPEGKPMSGAIRENALRLFGWTA